MKEVKLTLAYQSGAVVPFRITAEGHTAIGDGVALGLEGHALADLLLDNLPGGTVVALIERLKERYAQYQPGLNPFLDGR